MSVSLEDSAEGHIRVLGYAPIDKSDIEYNNELDEYLKSYNMRAKNVRAPKHQSS